MRDTIGSSSHCFAVATAHGQLVFTNETTRELTEYGREELHGRPFSKLFRVPNKTLESVVQELATTDKDGVQWHTGYMITSADRQYRAELFLESIEIQSDTFVVFPAFAYPRTESSGEEAAADGLIPTEQVIAVLDSLEAVFTVSSVDEVLQIAVDAVAWLFESDVVCIRLFDEQTNTLERVAETERATELRQSQPGFDLSATHSGRAFRSGNPVIDHPVPDHETKNYVTSLHVPLGEIGVVTVFLHEQRAVNDRFVRVMRQFASLVARITTRIGKSEYSTPIDQPQQSFDTRLDIVRNLVTVANETVDSVRASESDDEVRHRVCEGLASSAVFDQVQILEVEPGNDWTVVETSERVEGEQSTLFPEFTDEQVQALIERASKEQAVWDSVCVSTGKVPQGHEATTESDEMVVGMAPILHEQQIHGVLLTSYTLPGGLQKIVEDLLGFVAQFAGMTIHAVQTRSLVLSEQRIEIEFEVTGPSCLAVPISDRLDCYCELEYNTLTSDGEHLLFLRASTSDAESIVDVALSVESVTNCRVISETDDSCYVEVTKTESVADAMMGVGATVTHASADRGTGTLVVEAPPTVNADNVVTAYTEQNPDSRFVAKRSIDQAIEMPHIVTGQLSEELTEKQCIALEAAYYGGYFDWPRGSTAEEIAMSLGVSSATFQEHLRVALDKLVELNLDNFDY